MNLLQHRRHALTWLWSPSSSPAGLQGAAQTTLTVDLGAQNRQMVSEVSYAGDEGGIICHIAPPDGREVIIVSLTHVRVPPSMPFAAKVLQYQKYRINKLRK